MSYRDDGAKSAVHPLPLWERVAAEGGGVRGS